MAEATAVSMDLSKLTPIKRHFILSILNYLKEESEDTDADTQEALKVAQQGIQAAYGVKLVPPKLCEKYTDIYAAFEKAEQQNGNMLSEACKYNVMGGEFKYVGRDDKAIDLFTKAIQLDDTVAVFYYNRSVSHGNLGDYESAIADGKMAIKINPIYSKAYNQLGLVYTTMGNYKDAIEAYQKAIEINPTKASFLENLKSTVGYMLQSPCGTQLPTAQMVSVDELIADKDKLNFAIYMMTDPSVRETVTQIVRMEESGRAPRFNTLLKMSLELVNHLAENDPDFLEKARTQGFAAATGLGAAKPKNSKNGKGNGPSAKK